MKLIVLYVCVAGPMGSTRHLITIIPTKFTYLAFIGGTSGHYGLWHFAIGHIYIITS
jgi:hypothetical protein